ncbi:transposase [Streptomyces sp. NPDC056013]|uniref:transposase n=1 Tax=Streptomyces sp. NPDC056013 TaxID=3345680 RepID=UPI0035D77221
MIHGAGRSHGRTVGSVVANGQEDGRPPVWSRQQLIDGIRLRVRTGVPWRDVPAE